MKKITIIFLVVLFALSNNVFSQGSLVRNTKSDQSIIFNLQGLGELKAASFGGGIGYQYFFADRLAGRIGVGLNSISEKVYPLSADSNLIPSEARLMSFALTPGIKYNLSKSSTVAAFIGAEFIYQYNSTNKKYQDNKLTDAEITESTTEIGGGLFLGVEWFAWENVSLGAEYKLLFTKQTGEHKSEAPGYEENYNLPEKSIFGIGTGNYNFTVSFYF